VASVAGKGQQDTAGPLTPRSVGPAVPACVESTRHRESLFPVSHLVRSAHRHEEFVPFWLLELQGAPTVSLLFAAEVDGLGWDALVDGVEKIGEMCHIVCFEPAFSFASHAVGCFCTIQKQGPPSPAVLASGRLKHHPTELIERERDGALKSPGLFAPANQQPQPEAQQRGDDQEGGVFGAEHRHRLGEDHGGSHAELHQLRGSVVRLPRLAPDPNPEL
jgi:hypothetical protein